ncbi:hypothetical protein Goari_025048 [Gossypium aridum]|uniref:Ferredoxin-thioredoxin reductase catalytic chain, chloroplastic n=1 Tax=Gossypium aridum TaxID=34290 RepID=A0A7J8X8X5_GOSAI|nr:hypothetical protein [Gossypium aridum]
MTLQASFFNFGSISSLPCPPRTSRQRFVIRAKVEPSEKSVEIMRKFSEQYARRSGTYFCMDKGVTSVVIKVLFRFSLHLRFEKSPHRNHYPVLISP